MDETSKTTSPTRTSLKALLIGGSRADASRLAGELRSGGLASTVELAGSDLKIALKDAPDAVFLDLEGSGVSAAESLAASRAAGCDPPLLVLTDGFDEVAAARALGEGALGWSPKGAPALLVATLRQALRFSEAWRGLREQEERFHHFAGSSSEVVTVLDAQGTILYESPSVERILGREPGARLGENAFEVPLVHPDDVPEARDFLSDVIDGAGEASSEFRVRHADDSWRSIEVRASNLLHEPSVGGVVLNYRDVTASRRDEERIRRSLETLLALREAGQVLGSTLESEEIASRLLEIMQRVSSLTSVVISREDEGGELRIWREVRVVNLWPGARYSKEAEAARRAALASGDSRFFHIYSGSGEKLVGLCLPLRVRDHTTGVLEAYGPQSLSENYTVEVLRSLASQAASALENARLYSALADRERRLSSLVGKMFVVQEEERRNVAYEVHDGLAQMVAAAHQLLEAFARRIDSEEDREEFQVISSLVGETVAEARRIIADLRPTALDDFGLGVAVRMHIEELRRKGWEIEYSEDLGDQRLPPRVETALFRVFQEILTNVRKHADTSKVRAGLSREGEDVRLTVEDFGRGFVSRDSPLEHGPGARVGISGMRERTSLLGGELKVESRPGVGTLVEAEIPLKESRDEF